MMKGWLVGLNALVVAGCGGASGTSDCEGDECPCRSAFDCPADSPGPLGCYQETCWAVGEIPRSARCTEDSDCLDGACERGNETTAPEDYFCTNTCTGTSTAGCPSGWACYHGTQCLPLNSLPTGARCDNNLLCPETDTCITNICHTLCNVGYETYVCPVGQYCYVTSVPFCRDGKDCDPETDEFCGDPAKVCVELGNEARECRLPCGYTMTGGIYTDDCTDSIGFYSTTCAPLGIAAEAVCIEVGDRNAGQGCNNGTLRCKKGHICNNGVCRALCSSQVSCSSKTCTDITDDFRACL